MTDMTVANKRKGHPDFYRILQELEELHDRKNSDYAKDSDPLSNLRMSEEIGIPGYVGNFIRMGDKWSRITELTKKRLNGQDPAVKDERLQDTLRDLAVYCILEMILIDEYEQSQSR